MDPMDRFEFKRRINFQAIGAFIVGAVVAYLLHRMLRMQVYPPNGIFTLLVITGVGGLWYHIRRVV